MSDSEGIEQLILELRKASGDDLSYPDPLLEYQVKIAIDALEKRGYIIVSGRESDEKPPILLR